MVSTLTPKSTWLSKKQSQKDLLRTTLQSGKRTNKILGELSEQECVLNRHPELVESIIKLKDMKLLREKSLQITRYSEIPNVPVYNDYHSRETNPGYSRNKLGGFFTKWS